MSGPPSKLSTQLYLINRQIKSGKTRKGKDLDTIPGKREQLEEEKVAILTQMQEAKDKRHDERMNSIKEHATGVGEKTTADVIAYVNKKVDPLLAFIRGGGSDNPQERIKYRLIQNATNNKANKDDRILVKEANAKAKALAKGKAKGKAKAKAKAKAREEDRIEASDSEASDSEASTSDDQSSTEHTINVSKKTQVSDTESTAAPSASISVISAKGISDGEAMSEADSAQPPGKRKCMQNDEENACAPSRSASSSKDDAASSASLRDPEEALPRRRRKSVPPWSGAPNEMPAPTPPAPTPPAPRAAAKPPTVSFACRSDDRDRIKPIVDEVKEILKDIGSYDQGLELTKEAREQNIQFVKQLYEKLKILNDKTHKKGFKDIAKWTPCEYIAISDAENKTLCQIMPR